MVTRDSKATAIAAFSVAAILAATSPAPATTFTVLHTFTNGADGANPLAGLTVDSSGDLFGTAQNGGAGYGTAFELKRLARGWQFDVLHTFASGTDGAAPIARLMPGPQGRLYGTTSQGVSGGGGVFDLAATPKTFPRKETQLYAFASPGNGYSPTSGDLTFDTAGNIYGTTTSGGIYNGGTVFKLTHVRSGWKESVLYNFGQVGDGSVPYAGVIGDAAGNLYGTTSAGGSAGDGTVFELTPKGLGYTETILHSFQGQSDGLVPYSGLTADSAGNIYGAATDGGTAGGGTIFMLSPSGGGWTFSPIFSAPGWGISGPFRTPYVDASGNVFGTTHCDGLYSSGSAYELVRSGGTYTYTSLHDFTGGADGQYVFANPVFDAHGNMYGTTQVGGSGYGVVWEVSP
jgi:uncharacterized repeat protein (TIGR03803 family)